MRSSTQSSSPLITIALQNEQVPSMARLSGAPQLGHIFDRVPPSGRVVALALRSNTQSSHQFSSSVWLPHHLHQVARSTSKSALEAKKRAITRSVVPSVVTATGTVDWMARLSEAGSCGSR